MFGQDWKILDILRVLDCKVLMESVFYSLMHKLIFMLKYGVDLKRHLFLTYYEVDVRQQLMICMTSGDVENDNFNGDPILSPVKQAILVMSQESEKTRGSLKLHHSMRTAISFQYCVTNLEWPVDY